MVSQQHRWEVTYGNAKGDMVINGQPFDHTAVSLAVGWGLLSPL